MVCAPSAPSAARRHSRLPRPALAPTVVADSKDAVTAAARGEPAKVERLQVKRVQRERGQMERVQVVADSKTAAAAAARGEAAKVARPQVKRVHMERDQVERVQMERIPVARLPGDEAWPGPLLPPPPSQGLATRPHGRPWRHVAALGLRSSVLPRLVLRPGRDRE